MNQVWPLRAHDPLLHKLHPSAVFLMHGDSLPGHSHRHSTSVYYMASPEFKISHHVVLKGDIHGLHCEHPRDQPRVMDVLKSFFDHHQGRVNFEAGCRARRGMAHGTKTATGKSRVFDCQHCHRAFTREEHLSRHVLLTHNKLKPFVCGICSRAFSRRDLLLRHAKNLHQGSEDAVSRIRKVYKRDEKIDSHDRKMKMSVNMLVS